MSLAQGNNTPTRPRIESGPPVRSPTLLPLGQCAPLDADVQSEPNQETDVQVETDVQAGAEEIYHDALKAMDMDSDSEESDVDSQFEFDMEDDFRE